MSLLDIVQLLRKRLVLILIMTLSVATISGVVSFFFMTPIYEASTQLLVNQSTSERPADSSDIETNLQLINTYNVIIKSPAILDLVRKDLKMEDVSFNEFSSKISVSNIEDSQVVTIFVQDTDPFVAKDIANTTANIFKREIVTLMNVDNVNILASATASESQDPIKPHPVFNIVIGIVVGIMLGAGIAFLLEHLDQTIKSSKDIELFLGIPVLGGVSTIEQKVGNEAYKARQGDEKW